MAEIALSMPDTPLTDLQLALSKAVDLARALPKGSVDRRYDALVGVYVTQIVAAVIEANGAPSNRTGISPMSESK